MDLGSFPILKTWKKKISKIDRMAVVDCVPNGFAVVLGAAVAGFHVFWAINGPECIDATWDRVNKGSRKHRKFKFKGLSVGPLIGPTPGRWGLTMISLGNMAQKIGFGLGLVDGVLDGVYYGSSLARRYSGCTNPTAPYSQLTTGPVVPALFPAADFLYASWVQTAHNVFNGGPTGVALGPTGLQMVTAAFGLKQSFNDFFPLPDCTFTSELIWLPSGSPVQQLWGGFGTNVTGTGVLYGQDILPSPGDTFIGVRIRKTDGVMSISDGFFTVTGGGIDAGLAAYKCGAKIGLNP